MVTYGSFLTITLTLAALRVPITLPGDTDGQADRLGLAALLFVVWSGLTWLRVRMERRRATLRRDMPV